MDTFGNYSYYHKNDNVTVNALVLFSLIQLNEYLHRNYFKLVIVTWKIVFHGVKNSFCHACVLVHAFFCIYLLAMTIANVIISPKCKQLMVR